MFGKWLGRQEAKATVSTGFGVDINLTLTGDRQVRDDKARMLGTAFGDSSVVRVDGKTFLGSADVSNTILGQALPKPWWDR